LLWIENKAERRKMKIASVVGTRTNLSRLVKRGESEEVDRNYPLKFGRLPEIKGNSRVVATVFSPELEGNSFKEKAIKGLWHDYGTIMARFNKRQISSIEYVTKNKKITRLKYEKNYGISKRTAVREIKEIVNSGILKVVGKGPGTYYTLAG
jgi:hypothetical protein